jgi:hypothetical protein
LDKTWGQGQIPSPALVVTMGSGTIHCTFPRTLS